MDNLFMIIFLLSIVCLIIGLIKPKLVVRWGNEEKRNRKKVLSTYGTMLIVSFVLFCIFVDPVESKDQSQQVEVAEEKVEYTLEEISQEKDDKEEEEEILEEKNYSEEREIPEEKETIEEKDDTENISEEELVLEAQNYRYNFIDYNQLARFPDEYKGFKISIFGEVLQVMEFKDHLELRVAVLDDYNNVMYCIVPNKLVSARVLEGDSVTVNGESDGIITYESIKGGDISIPKMNAEDFSIDEDYFDPNEIVTSDDY